MQFEHKFSLINISMKLFIDILCLQELLILSVLVASIIYSPGKKIDIPMISSPQLVANTYTSTPLSTILAAQENKLFLITNGHIQNNKLTIFIQVLKNSFRVI